MTISFVLAGRASDTVYMRVYWNNQEYRRSTGVKLDARFWDKAHQRVRITSEYLAARHINRVLDNMRKDFEERYWEMRADTMRELSKDEIDTLFLPRQEKTPRLVEYASQLIENEQKKTNRRTGVLIKKSTYQKSLNVIRHLDELEKKIGPLTLLKCDMSFYQAYVDYMVEGNYSLNYIGKHLSIIRGWLKQAESEGKAVSPAFKSKDWYIGRERTSHVSLSLHELKRISALELTGRKEIVRDLFLLSAYTGLRYSDVSRLNEAEFRNGVIVIEQQKTSDEVVVPELPEVSAILKKYKNRHTGFPSPVHNATMNALLKEIALEAGLTDPYVMRRTQGGERIENKIRICDAVTTHTARRSFAKNLFVSGFNLSWLSRVLGHSSQEQTVDYIGMDAMEKALLLKKHWESFS